MLRTIRNIMLAFVPAIAFAAMPADVDAKDRGRKGWNRSHRNFNRGWNRGNRNWNRGNNWNRGSNWNRGYYGSRYHYAPRYYQPYGYYGQPFRGGFYSIQTPFGGVNILR
jgi:hypothetical protein